MAPAERAGSLGRLPRLKGVLLPFSVVTAVGLLVTFSALRPAQQQPAASGPASAAITVSRSACGAEWTDPKPGEQTFSVRNTGSVPTEVDLIQVPSGAVYGEVEGIGPGTTRSMRVDLGSGSYAFRCAPQDKDAIVGPTVHIGGHTQGGPAAVPVTTDDLLVPLRQYQGYVQTGLGDLATKVQALQTAVHEGNLNGARTAWLPAHLAYERLGAAYDAFGDYDGKIDGRPDGLPGGVNDPGFTGFHRVEYGLWHGESAASLTASVDDLMQNVQGLRAAFPTMQVDPLDLGLRAHEILENTLQFELSGHTDEGSGTNLATADANLDGTEEVLAVLRPLLVTRYPALPEVDSGLARVRQLVDAARRPDGSWVSVTALPSAQREQLDGAVGDLVEKLAPIADICEPRRTS